MRPPRSRVPCLAAIFVLLAPACARDRAQPAPLDAGAAAQASSPSGATSAETSQADDEVRPVYPLDESPPDPLAERLCRALHDAPARRRAACCASSADLAPTRECVRTVSAALALGGVTLAAPDVDRCARAIDLALAGCDFVASLVPPAPAECEGIFRGAYQVGQACRSSLECATGLHCAGAGPTELGRCAPAGENGAACSRSVDVLGAFARQDTAEADHPPCEGTCRMGKCVGRAPEGGACLSSGECATGTLCVARVCARARPGRRGEACPAGECEGALLCVDGRCAPPRGEGEECTMPWDCRGACVRAPGETKGKCASPCAR